MKSSNIIYYYILKSDTTRLIRNLLITSSFFFCCCVFSDAQSLTQTLKGIIIDSETRIPISGANIIILNSEPLNGTKTENDGRFRLIVEIGRVSIKSSYLGYEDFFLRDIFITTGKEVEITIEMHEQVLQMREVVVRANQNDYSAINMMASISAHTLRTEDALRYAGGYYDPSRIVSAFAGIVNANSDQSNEIVIRGNSSRGLLWRLEGIEIPNPNHFSNGQGGSGGAFSAITSNVITNFDFFTGAFPAEFGNAFSGVMDLNLRKGNTDKREYAFQTGMIGAELSIEGPFSKNSESSYLVNARYVNFKILSDLNIIDLGETNYAPRTQDLVFNFNLPTKKIGNINFFGVYGSSALGKIAKQDYSLWTSISDRWEEMEMQNFSITGIKHLFSLPDGKTYIRSVLAYTDYFESYSEGYIDSSYIHSNSYYSRYQYPSLRSSILINHKINAKHTLRAGINYDFLSGDMVYYRLNSSNNFDTLVNSTAQSNLFQSYAQWKTKITDNLEINSGIHILYYNINNQLSFEPRFGLSWHITPGSAFSAGIGLHSRTESLSVYYSLIKGTDGLRTLENKDLKLSKSFHYVTGFDFSLKDNIHVHIEAYYQYLFNIPIVDKITSKYSTINSSEGLTDAALVNKGLGFNKGLELTIEKAFTKNYYFLATASVFDSKYKPGDHHWYNTYYNTSFVSNVLVGKDFYIGKNHQNSIGLNVKYIFRGGYRYTPVDIVNSIKSKRIITNTSLTYENQLPDFIRLDAGINFRKNNPHYSWIVMLDVQNVTNRKNVFRKKFEYYNGTVISYNTLSLGTIPVFNFRIEF